MSLSVDELLQNLKKSRLLSENQLALVQESVAASTKKLTADLVLYKLSRQGLVTEWQSKMLLQKQTSFLIGNYKLLQPIGKGGMGKVFKAWDRKKKRNVAIKVLSKKMAKNKKLVARFKREIEVATRLDSPYIVKTLDAGEVGQSHFMVMEFVDGESLDVIANRQGRIKPTHACEIIRQAACGLRDAHAGGMVHRDIKPGNLMVSFHDGKPQTQLLDMGLARVETEENDGMTKTGQVMGTPDYMAPEQGWNTADVDVRADIYSLGCTMFRLVTGGVPFPGDNPLQVLMARCSADAPLASSVVPDLDPRIDAVIRRMTWRDPTKRYQRPVEVVAALESLSESMQPADLQGGTGSASPSAQATMVAADPTQPTGPAEPSFQEFLRDVDSGAEVSLMQGSSEGFAGPAPNMAKPGATKPKKSGSKMPLFAGVGLAVLLAGGTGIALVGGGGSDDSNEDSAKGNNAGKTIASPPPRTVVYFAEVPAQRAEPGEVVSFFAAAENALDGVTYEFGKGAPKEATLEADSGEFYWLPPIGQEPGRITIELLAKRGDKVEARQEVFVDIKAVAISAKLLEFTNLRAQVNVPLKHMVKILGQGVPDGSVRFQIAGDAPDGLSLDARTGELTWTPGPTQTGRHPVSLQLVESASERVLHTASCSLVVLRALGLKAQTAAIDQELEVTLAEQLEMKRALKNVSWTMGLKGVDLGAAVDTATGTFRWTPKSDQVGVHAFNFTLNRAGDVLGTATMAVTVAKKSISAPDSPEATGDSKAGEIAEAEAKVRELFKRDFASRSSSTKRELAEKLLNRAFEDGGSESMQFALLKLAAEVAKNSKAYGTGAEAVAELAARFKTDSVQQMTDLIDGFRARGLSASNKLLIAEASIREARAAIDSNRFQSASKLIDVADSLGTAGGYTAVTKPAKKLLKSLPTKSDEPEALDDKQNLARNELLELLGKYQYESAFRAKPGLTAIGGADDPTAGVDLWDVKDGRLLMESEPDEMITGLIDPAVTHASFVLRLKVGNDSTVGALVLGAPANGSLADSIVVPLAGADSFQVQIAGQSGPLARPKVRITRQKGAWSLVEVRVEGTRLQIKLNGRIVTEARLPEAPKGSIGLAVVLRPNIAEPRFRAANVRVMGIVE